MARSRMRYRGAQGTRDLRQLTTARDEAVKHAGDAPLGPARPPVVRWSLESYPYAEPLAESLPEEST